MLSNPAEIWRYICRCRVEGAPTQSQWESCCRLPRLDPSRSMIAGGTVAQPICLGHDRIGVRLLRYDSTAVSGWIATPLPPSCSPWS
jgi:hypothetical protein